MLGSPFRSEPWKQRAGSYPTGEDFTTEHLCLILLAAKCALRFSRGKDSPRQREWNVCVLGGEEAGKGSVYGRGEAEPKARVVRVFHHQRL